MQQPVNLKRILEIAAFSAEAALLAARSGADRIELCSGYAEGGLTPSEGMIRLVKENTSIPVFIMIRPHGGDFCYSEESIRSMEYDIERGLALGADGFVFGCMKKGGTVDTKNTSLLVKQCAGKPVTFHRAFDTCRDPFEALESLISCGIQRILSSGQKTTAAEGAELLAALNTAAANRIVIMPGAGINPGNIRLIAEKTGCTEFHASAKRYSEDSGNFGFGEHVLPDTKLIAALKEELI